jgi:AraC-like DNA-binding protein
MPIFMDRHDVSEHVTANNVAQLHQEDLKVEHLFNCRGLTYWFDEKRKTAFCLIDAPDEQSIRNMHNHAHGEVPHRIIEVDANVVESFLGRIEDPAKEFSHGLNIIDDPALRTVMIVRFEGPASHMKQMAGIAIPEAEFLNPVVESCLRHHGNVVRHYNDRVMAAFNNITDALNVAVELKLKCENLSEGTDLFPSTPKIGLSAGLPVTDQKAIFEDTIKLAGRLSFVANVKILVSSGICDLYLDEDISPFFGDTEKIHFLTPPEEHFINQLLDFTDREWENPELKVDDFTHPLGLSKSQLYRKMILLTGMPPNQFLRDYRLNMALEMIGKKTMNLSEIAFNTGFGSLSYFSKCFVRRYGLSPSEYLRNTAAGDGATLR